MFEAETAEHENLFCLTQWTDKKTPLYAGPTDGRQLDPTDVRPDRWTTAARGANVAALLAVGVEDEADVQVVAAVG